jgi:hypothetical protein
MAINSATAKGTKLTPFELFFGEKPPSLIQPHEISGEYEALYKPTPPSDSDSIAESVLARRAALNKLAQ